MPCDNTKAKFPKLTPDQALAICKIMDWTPEQFFEWVRIQSEKLQKKSQ